MNIIVGSNNPAKIAAVRDLVAQYREFAGAEVSGTNADSDVSAQPMTLEETIRGARNRAAAAQAHGDIGFGLEGGMMPVPYTQSTYMLVSVVAVFDGARYAIGLSSGIELPKKIVRAVLDEGMELADACVASGVTSESTALKHGEGLIGLLTNGRTTRAQYFQEALRCALAQRENNHFYE